ncbi:hypothetical protein B566_EDAN013012, partial [Ephemera danica]
MQSSIRSIPREDVTDTDMFKIPEIHRTETDAIHSRFITKEKYLYKCNSCQFSSPDWKKVKKHFFEHCPALTADYSEKTCQCGGPSFKPHPSSPVAPLLVPSSSRVWDSQGTLPELPPATLEPREGCPVPTPASHSSSSP